MSGRSHRSRSAHVPSFDTATRSPCGGHPRGRPWRRSWNVKTQTVCSPSRARTDRSSGPSTCTSESSTPRSRRRASAVARASSMSTTTSWPRPQSAVCRRYDGDRLRAVSPARRDPGRTGFGRHRAEASESRQSCSLGSRLDAYLPARGIDRPTVRSRCAALSPRGVPPEPVGSRPIPTSPEDP